MMNRFYGEHFGSLIGEVNDIDVNTDRLGWGPYLRIKVWVDITKPLMCGTLLNHEGKLIWIPLKYKRLSNFCFKYGVIKHVVSGCTYSGMVDKIHDYELN